MYDPTDPQNQASQPSQQPAQTPYQQSQPYQPQPAQAPYQQSQPVQPQQPYQQQPPYQQPVPYQQPAAYQPQADPFQQQSYQQPGQYQPQADPFQQPGQYQQPFPYQQPYAPAPAQPAENVAKGMLGAFLGSLLGVLAIIVFSRLGIVSAISGLVMSFCALKGYEKLAGSVSKRGVVLCAVLLVVMVFVADYIDWAIVVADNLGVDVIKAMPYIFRLIDVGAIDAAGYAGNLAILYLFAALGAVPVVVSAFQSK